MEQWRDCVVEQAAMLAAQSSFYGEGSIFRNVSICKAIPAADAVFHQFRFAYACHSVAALFVGLYFVCQRRHLVLLALPLQNVHHNVWEWCQGCNILAVRQMSRDTHTHSRPTRCLVLLLPQCPK